MLNRVSTGLVGIAVASIVLSACGGSGKSTSDNSSLDSGAATDTTGGADAGNADGQNSGGTGGTGGTTNGDAASGNGSNSDGNSNSNSGGASGVDGSLETKVLIEPPEGYAGEIQPVLTPDESSPFSKFQLDDALYTNNVYDGRQLDPANNWKLIFYNGVQDFVRWEIPALLGNDPSPCARPQADEPITLRYRLTSRKDSPSERNTFVRSYPAMVVGTMGGRFESWGVECGQLDTILPQAQRHGGSPVYQMETVAEKTGLPVLAGELDYNIRVSVKADLNSAAASKGVANVFMDSYWHNVSDPALVPDKDVVNTINGISSDFTEVWNLNIWFDYPRFEGRASSWTGGFKIGSLSLIEGGDFDVYFKVEGPRDGHLPKCRLGTNENCFLYIGLVATDNDAARKGITVNYTEISNWMLSPAFRDLFLTGAFESDTPAAKAYEAWRLMDGTDNDNNPDPAKRGPRFPDNDHVIGGIHLGSELWYNPTAEEAAIVFDTLGVEVEGVGRFGRYVNHE